MEIVSFSCITISVKFESKSTYFYPNKTLFFPNKWKKSISPHENRQSLKESIFRCYVSFREGTEFKNQPNSPQQSTNANVTRQLSFPNKRGNNWSDHEFREGMLRTHGACTPNNHRVQGEGVFLGNPKDSVWEDWGTLGNIRETPPLGPPLTTL